MNNLGDRDGAQSTPACLILQFSGSGNSRMVAQSLARRLDNAPVLPLLGGNETSDALKTATRVCMVFPVHFMQLPRSLSAHIKALDLREKLVFLIATSGGEAGDAIGQAADAASAAGGRIVATLHAPLADNSVVLKTPAPQREAWFAALPGLLDNLATHMREAVTDDSPDTAIDAAIGKRRRLWWRLSGDLLRVGMNLAYGMGRKRVAADTCNGCGACLRACPVGNLTMVQVDGHPRASFGPACLDCFGCLHGCPQSAISFGRIRVSPETRYRAPTPV